MHPASYMGTIIAIIVQNCKKGHAFLSKHPHGGNCPPFSPGILQSIP